MEQAIEQAVERAIATMRDKLGEQLTVDGMARAALFSKFHFTRMFHRATGVSPGRFLSALRLQEAKRLLVSTSLSVADISLRVGYNSVGTFSARFSRSVGLSPSTYRRLSGVAPFIRTDPAPSRRPTASRVHGQVRLWQAGTEAPVYIGLFAYRIPESRPVRCAMLPGPGPYQFDNVPTGSWYVLTQSVHGDRGAGTDGAQRREQVFVATHGPITVSSDSDIRVDLALQPIRTVDPPVLLALADARESARARHVAQQQERSAA